jgi:hypothetical protein
MSLSSVFPTKQHTLWLPYQQYTQHHRSYNTGSCLNQKMNSRTATKTQYMLAQVHYSKWELF